MRKIFLLAAATAATSLFAVSLANIRSQSLGGIIAAQRLPAEEQAAGACYCFSRVRTLSEAFPEKKRLQRKRFFA